MTPPPHMVSALPRGSWAGRLALRYFHTPRARWQAIRAEGLLPYWLERRGEAAMRRKAHHLPSLRCANTNGQTAPVVFMTGTRYWHESVFCAHSLVSVADHPPVLKFVSDGTLSNGHAHKLQQLFPGATVVDTATVEQGIAQRFPSQHFPLIRFYRQHKPIMRKLLDVFALSEGPQLLLDSDMLFFNQPTEMLAWTRRPVGKLAMVDIKTAYGYPRELMTALAGHPIPEKVNIGVFGMTGADLDWREIEHWIRTLTETEGLHYNLCQCLSAMLYARGPFQLLPPERYRILPDREESKNPATTVMHHYVAESKQWYRRFAWRRYA